MVEDKNVYILYLLFQTILESQVCLIIKIYQEMINKIESNSLLVKVTNIPFPPTLPIIPPANISPCKASCLLQSLREPHELA